MGPDYRFRKNRCFYLSFFPKSRTNYSFQGKTNYNKKFCYYQGNRFSFTRNLLQKFPPLIRGKLYKILQKKAIKNKTLFQLIQIKFLASKNHSLQFFQIPYSENIFLSEYFSPASGNLFSVQWKQYVFAQSLFSDVGNHY